MNDMKKSDEPVRAMRLANNGRPPAELAEQRGSTKEKPGSQATRRTQCRGSVPSVADRIRQAAERNLKDRLTALLHHVTPEAYGEGLEERLLNLHRRVQVGAYRTLPVRRVTIPKPDGGTRPLGIAALEDKIVQRAVCE